MYSNLTNLGEILTEPDLAAFRKERPDTSFARAKAEIWCIPILNTIHIQSLKLLLNSEQSEK